MLNPRRDASAPAPFWTGTPMKGIQLANRNHMAITHVGVTVDAAAFG